MDTHQHFIGGTWTDGGATNGPASIIAPPALRDRQAPALGPVPAIGQHSDVIRAEFAAPAVAE